MNTPFRNRMKGKVNVWWEKVHSVNNNLVIPEQSVVENFLGVPFRNRMKGNFDIIAPERKVSKLNPIHDTFVSEINPYLIYGRSNNILVGYDDNKKYEGLLRFNLQEVFPMYNKDNYILLDSVLKLIVSNTRDIEDSNLDFYEVFLGDWEEDSTTWANKPIKSNILASTYLVEGDEGNTGNITIYADMNDLVPNWLENPRKNNGILIETREIINNIISFYSKENGNEELNPQLIITYIDLNSPFVIKNEYLNASVNVWEGKSNIITSELEVITRQSTNTIISELLVLNKPGDLLASLEIVKKDINCELGLVGDNIKSEVTVFINKTNRILNSLNVKQISLENEIKISKLYDLNANLEVKYGEYLKGFLGINANRLVNEIDFIYEASIDNKIHISSFNYINSDINIKKEFNLMNILMINSNKWYVLNELYLSSRYYIENNISYSKFSDLTAELHYSNKDDINNDIYVSKLSSLNFGLHYSNINTIENDIFYGKFSDLTAELYYPNTNILSVEVKTSNENSIINELKTIDTKYIEIDLQISNSDKVLNELYYSKIDNINNMVYTINDYVVSNLKINPVKQLQSEFLIQSWVLDNNLHISYLNDLQNNIVIPCIKKLNNTITLINEHIENSLNVYVKKTKYIDSQIHALAIDYIQGSMNFQYSNELNGEIFVYVDKISVLSAYLEIVNEEWEYNQRRGYGYIM